MPRIPLTPDMIETLNAHRIRTGIGPHVLLRNKRKELPKGLNSSVVKSGLMGLAKTIREDHYNYILKLYEALPDDPYVKISQEQQEQLKVLKGQAATIARNSTIDSTMANWIVTGKIKMCRKSELEFLLKAAEKPITTPTGPMKHHQSERTPFTDEIWKELKRYRDEYGILPGKIFKNAEDIPEGLKPHNVSHWISRKPKSVNKDHLDWVLKACANVTKAIDQEQVETLQKS